MMSRVVRPRYFRIGIISLPPIFEKSLRAILGVVLAHKLVSFLAREPVRHALSDESDTDAVAVARRAVVDFVPLIFLKLAHITFHAAQSIAAHISALTAIQTACFQCQGKPGFEFRSIRVLHT